MDDKSQLPPVQPYQGAAQPNYPPSSPPPIGQMPPAGSSAYPQNAQPQVITSPAYNPNNTAQPVSWQQPYSQPYTQTKQPLTPAQQSYAPVGSSAGKRSGVLRKVMMVVGAVLTILIIVGAVIGGLSYWNQRNGQQAGVKNVDEFMSLLKSADTDAASAQHVQQIVLNAYGINEKSTNPADLQRVTKLAADTSVVAQSVKTHQPTKYKTVTGKNKLGRKAVNAFYELQVDKGKEYYRVTSEQQPNNTWKIVSLTLSDTKLND